MKSVMKHQFSRVPKAEIPRSSFDRSHGYKTTFDGGRLVPIFLDEALPGDTFSFSLNAFARMATPLFPVMDNARLSFYFFAVPHRLVWDNWEKFCGAQDDPGDSTDYTIPIITSAGTVSSATVADYFGLPLGAVYDDLECSALPFRAHNLIYNEWFRDQNLQDSVVVQTDDGPDALGQYALNRRGKPHDYFTSALPWPQKGDSIDIPLGGTAPVIPGENPSYGNAAIPSFDTANLSDVDIEATMTTGVLDIGAPNATDSLTWNEPALVTDLSNATAATINQLRQAFQVQKLLERDARGGTRYTEVIKAHFGVTSPDARLQRPEFLGGGRTSINISPVPQTSETDSSPQGNLAAYGTASVNGVSWRKSFTEHCILIGYVCATADLTYQQGMNRMWSRSTRYDFYWPALAHIGEQAVLNKEIYWSGASADDEVFGYQERFAEYRYKPSQITGLFRSDATGTLDAWHYSQDFSSLPTLNSAFIQEMPPFDRVIATPEEPHFIYDSYINMRCARPMPLYGVPGQIDRF